MQGFGKCNDKNDMKAYILLAYFILCILIFLRPIQLIYEQRHKFFSRGYINQYEPLRKAYQSSQYVKKENPGIIPDETFEAFVGGYLYKGGNPILVTHDQPPLGRYIIALSIFLFDNVHTNMIFLLFLSIGGIFLIAKSILKNTFLSLIPVAVFVNEPLFLSKLVYSPLLEPIQLPFIVLALYFFIRGVSTKNSLKWFILSAIMLGFVISTRFFVVGAMLVLGMLLYFFIKKHIDKKVLMFTLSLPLALVVLLFSYVRTIQDGYTIWQIFGVQKYIFFYHHSKFILPFSFWDLIFFNRWHTWWGDRSISSDYQWIIAWPIATILTLFLGILALLKKVKLSSTELVLIFWVLLYSLALSSGYTSTRYFLPLVPFLYILATAFLVRCFRILLSKIKEVLS